MTKWIVSILALWRIGGRGLDEAGKHGKLKEKVQEVIVNLKNGEAYDTSLEPLLANYDYHLFRNLIQ